MGSIYTAALMEHNAHPDYKYQAIDAIGDRLGSDWRTVNG